MRTMDLNAGCTRSQTKRNNGANEKEIAVMKRNMPGNKRNVAGMKRNNGG